MKYHIWTIGCQMNKADSWHAAQELEAQGHVPTKSAEDADIVVLNTCVVRQSAEDKVYGRLSSLKPLKRHNPHAAVVVMGCLVEEDSTALQECFPFVDLFLPPSDVQGLMSLVTDKWGDASSQAGATASPVPVSCHVPVMQGCDNLCTYCIVRLRRGKERSRPVAEIVEEVLCLAQRGAREVTLLGQNVDAYGHGLPGQPDLADLLRTVHEVDDLWRIRFLTSHPNDMSDGIIEAVAELDKVCEHIELPVQAGHDLTLKRMGRGYTVNQYRRLVERIRDHVPGVALATDVIVGFPGETEDQFQATYELLAEQRFDVVHVAAYSPRPGTPAARLDDDVPQQQKERRRRLIEELQRQIAAEINHELLESTTEILVEDKHKGKWRGRTRTNKLVFFNDDADWRGKLARVEVTWAGPWSMQGKLRMTDLASGSLPFP
ncbi:MAG: tRNA (N6-isopentenyl adenosine(37)-C2)-methylthiotransferase MiaB [Chloroflexi bacterium B3_Chlor]|nr:MAG: tRNA (N6-isopentenyl adenosine(37)-C2)-methylthiotransferase MiaB [Chloroflexi bacterium B3_Chlor]